MSVGFASVNGGYATTVTLGHFSDNKQWNPVQKDHGIEHINGDRYIPFGIRPITQGGHLIQEDSDNIDINAETVDGKNTFHSRARAVFQFKCVDKLAVCAERILRGRDSY
jgi:S1-C subfamily serine protease